MVEAWSRAGLIVPHAFVLAWLAPASFLEEFAHSADESADVWQAAAVAKGRVTGDEGQADQPWRARSRENGDAERGPSEA